MQDLNDLFYYAQVVEHGGFAPAARALGIPKSRLSRRITELEKRLRLLNRSTRHFSLTEIGAVYYQHCRAVIVQAEAAQEAIDSRRGEPCGLLRISCPVALVDVHVGSMVAAFMDRHPRLELQLEATNRRVDVIAEGIDVAIRVRPPPLEDSDLVRRILGQRAQCLVASPSLVADIGNVAAPSDLAGFPGLALGTAVQSPAWKLLGPGGVSAQVEYRPRLVTTSMHALREAALAGIGIVQLPVMMMTRELAAGSLVRLLPGWAPPDEIIHAVFASRRGLLPSVRMLLDELAEKFSALQED